MFKLKALLLKLLAGLAATFNALAERVLYGTLEHLGGIRYIQASNQFAQTPELGMVDLAPAYPVSAMIDSSVGAATYGPGQAMKLIDSPQGGLPHIVPVATIQDEVYCFIPYTFKKNVWGAGDVLSVVAFGGGVIYLYATAAFNRGTHLQLDLTQVGGVTTAVPGAKNSIIGHAFDKAVNVGDLVRVVTFLPAAFVS